MKKSSIENALLYVILNADEVIRRASIGDAPARVFWNILM